MMVGYKYVCLICLRLSKDLLIWYLLAKLHYDFNVNVVGNKKLKIVEQSGLISLNV